MAPLDMTVLPDLSDDAPAGDNLELDPEFGELERAAQGKPEVQYGKTIEPAVPPDWKETASIAESLMKRTRDLRVMVHLAIARLNLKGIPEFAQTVRMIRAQLDTRWDQVHPQLDPEDDLDPMQRANAVLRLQDPAAVLRPLRDAPLAFTPRTGPITWRDIAVFNGAIEPEAGKEKMSEAAIIAAFTGTDPQRLDQLRDAVDSAVEDLAAIPAAFDKNAGAGSGPDYTTMAKLFRDIQRDLKRYAAVQAPPPPEEEEAAPAAGAESGAPARTEAPAGRGFASIKAITSLTKRDEALHALELATTYFRTYEPSSPLPLLLDRAKRLGAMEFMDILRDLAPDGLNQVQVIAGPTTE